MENSKLLMELLDTSMENISPELFKKIGGNVSEWRSLCKQTKNPWDRITTYILAAIFKTKLD